MIQDSSADVNRPPGTVKYEVEPPQYYAETHGEVKILGEKTDVESIVSLREIVEGFNQQDPETGCEEWVMEGDYMTLEDQIIQFVREKPGRSCNAIFNHFKQKGFNHSHILEIYNILVYSKKALQRLNVGTVASPRYAHFVDFFEFEPRKDALYDVLGPIPEFVKSE